MTKLPDPGRPLSAEAAVRAFDAILDGEIADADLAAFLLALSERGETADEIAAAAGALRARMVPVAAPAHAIDVCGTGGDGSHSLNISTAVTFVVAAAGVPVAKHGNRGASSRSGTADVLEALGWQGDLPLDRVEAALSEIGVTFLFAQRHHPALGRVAGVRRGLRRRTIFNLLGPLANPAGVRRQMLGVFAPGWLRPMAEAAHRLGGTHILTVHGGGLDEIALHAPSELVWLADGALRTEQVSPADLGIEPASMDALRGGDPPENAAALKALMAGDRSTSQLRAYADIVTLNAAAALRLADAADDWPTAIALARHQLESGAAADRLAQFLAFR